MFLMLISCKTRGGGTSRDVSSRILLHDIAGIHASNEIARLVVLRLRETGACDNRLTCQFPSLSRAVGPIWPDAD